MRQARGLLEPLAARFAAGPTLRDGGKAAQTGPRMGPLLNRSEEVYACLYLPAPAASPGAPPVPAAELAVTGRWSPGPVSARLDWSCGWVRQQPSPDSPPYWRARRSPLEVGSPVPGLLLVATGLPNALERMAARRLSPRAGPVERAREQDPQVGPFLAGAALYAFLPMPGTGGAAGASGAADKGGGLPVRELWLAAYRGQDQYELGARAALAPAPAEQPNARALTGLIRLAAAGWLRKAGIPEVAARLRAMDIEVQAGGLTVRGLRLAEPEMLALLQNLLGPAVEDSGARGGD